MNPVDVKPTASFAEAKEAEPTAIVTDVNTFKIALFEGSVRMGWLGENSSGWAVLVTDPGQATTLHWYPYNGVQYIRKGSNDYMSVSNQAYVGFYGWLGRSGFKLQDGYLISDFNGQKLSLYSTDNGYLYCWDAYTVLRVELQPA